jgi:hypothetical protein
MVAVRMVSEGVDIPRLAVGVYATSTSTPLFFAQAIGRFVRARRRGETASVFLPSVPVLLGFAAELEAARDHVLKAPGSAPEEDELAEALRERNNPDADLDKPKFEALNASAHFDRVLFDGGEFGTAAAAGSAEEEDYLGLPGLLDPDQVRMLLRKRQEKQVSARSSEPRSEKAEPEEITREALAALRKELNGLVGAWSQRTSQPHGVIHAELRRQCGGPPLAQATADQVRARITKIRAWATTGRQLSQRGFP